MVLHFGPFTLDLGQRRLVRDGGESHLAPKAFDTLALLVAQRPRAVSKDEILSTVWAGVFVTESTLATTIRDLRRVLDDRADEPTYIRTSFAFGYAFVAEVTVGADRPAADAPSPWRLVCDRTILPLRTGSNIVGRGLPGGVTLDAPTISRSHARLTVAGAQVVCEDLESKNGTWIGTTRVTTPTIVGDGDEIRFGAVVVVLRLVPPLSTQAMPAGE